MIALAWNRLSPGFRIAATKSLHLIPAILLVAMSLPAASTEEQWQKPAFILNAFSEIALKNEYGPDDGRIKKWHSPVYIWIEHQVGEQALHEKLLQWHVQHLADITGHPVNIAKTPEQANVRFIFTRFENMQEMARRELGTSAEKILYATLCLARIKTDSHNRITRALIILPVDQARMHGKLISCIVEEMTQVMGLVNDSDAVYPSIFNDRTPNELLSGLDYLLLKILYDPRIQAGMQTSEAVHVARTIITELSTAGEISQAWRKVSTGELYRLLGYR